MFLTMFFKTQNIVPTMHLTMLIAHPYLAARGNSIATIQSMKTEQGFFILVQHNNLKRQIRKAKVQFSDDAK